MRKNWAMALGLLVVLGLWTWTAGSSAASSDAGSTDSALVLREAAASINAGQPVKLVLKKSGPYRTLKSSGQLLRDGAELSRQLGLPEAAQLQKQDGESVYRAERTAAQGCAETLLLAEIDRGQSFLIVKYECSLTLQEAASVVSHQQELDRKLKELHFAGQWNVNVQGNLAEQADVQPESVLSEIGQRFSAHEEERYADTGTLSISYRTDKLHETVNSGGRMVSLQAALHRDSVTGLWRLTLGTPVITTEY